MTATTKNVDQTTIFTDVAVLGKGALGIRLRAKTVVQVGIAGLKPTSRNPNPNPNWIALDCIGWQA